MRKIHFRSIAGSLRRCRSSPPHAAAAMTNVDSADGGGRLSTGACADADTSAGDLAQVCRKG